MKQIAYFQFLDFSIRQYILIAIKGTPFRHVGTGHGPPAAISPILGPASAVLPPHWFAKGNELVKYLTMVFCIFVNAVVFIYIKSPVNLRLLPAIPTST